MISVGNLNKGSEYIETTLIKILNNWELIMIFFGGFIDQNGIILFEPYIIEKEYDVILIKKLIK